MHNQAVEEVVPLIKISLLINIIHITEKLQEQTDQYAVKITQNLSSMPSLSFVVFRSHNKMGKFEHFSVELSISNNRHITTTNSQAGINNHVLIFLPLITLLTK